jgi:acyl-CoA reductase-like NAD-dependent aldehyde dehydrogenase
MKETTVTQILERQFYMAGQWVQGAGDHQVLDVVNPATEERFARVPEASRADAIAAIQAARRAFDEGPWPRMSFRERAGYMLRLAQAASKRRDELIDLAVRETGATRAIAEAVHVDFALTHLYDMAERIMAGFQPYTGTPPIIGARLTQGVVAREPIGVASLITAYNFPLLLNATKLAPALGSGCTAVLKPSPMTPLQALVFAELADEVGLPPGVLNVVPGGVEVGDEMTTNPMVDMVSFTGSDTVGKQIVVQAAATLKRVVLELGGKSATIVFADADLNAAAQDVVFHMTCQAGQGCGLQTRTLVEESVHDDLVAKVAAIVARMEVGDPARPSVSMGPLISAVQRDRVEAFIASGMRQGAALAFGGGRPAHLGRGFFLEPTLFVDASNSMKIAQEEIFGPVGTFIRFRDRDEAVRLANDSRYGLAGGVWSSDTVKAFEVASQVRTGTMNINGGGGITPFAPFGGYKQSGQGREYGTFGLEEFLEVKFIGWPAGSPTPSTPPISLPVDDGSAAGG